MKDTSYKLTHFNEERKGSTCSAYRTFYEYATYNTPLEFVDLRSHLASKFPVPAAVPGRPQSMSNVRHEERSKSVHVHMLPKDILAEKVIGLDPSKRDQRWYFWSNRFVPPYVEWLQESVRCIEALSVTIQRRSDVPVMPEDFHAPDLVPHQCWEDARIEAAVDLYRQGLMSTGAAAEWAGVPKPFFLTKLSKYGVDTFDLEPDELQQDLVVARGHL